MPALGNALGTPFRRRHLGELRPYLGELEWWLMSRGDPAPFENTEPYEFYDKKKLNLPAIPVNNPCLDMDGLTDEITVTGLTAIDKVYNSAIDSGTAYTYFGGSSSLSFGEAKLPYDGSAFIASVHVKVPMSVTTGYILTQYDDALAGRALLIEIYSGGYSTFISGVGRFVICANDGKFHTISIDYDPARSSGTGDEYRLIAIVDGDIIPLTNTEVSLANTTTAIATPVAGSAVYTELSVTKVECAGYSDINLYPDPTDPTQMIDTISNAIYSSSGTSALTQGGVTNDGEDIAVLIPSTDTISATAGIVSGIYINSELVYPCAENQGSKLYSVSDNWPDAELVGTLATLRSTSDDAIPYGIMDGFTPYSYFDGSAYVTLDSLGLYGSKNRSVFVKATLGDDDALYNQGSSAFYTKTTLRSDGGYLRFEIQGAGLTTSMPIKSEATWYGFVLEGTKLSDVKIYNDGVFESSTDTVVLDTEDSYYALGASNIASSPDKPLAGTILKAVVFDRALSQSEIDNLDSTIPSDAIAAYVPDLTDPTRMVDLVSGTTYSSSGTSDLEQGNIPAKDATTDATGGELYKVGGYVHNGSPSDIRMTDTDWLDGNPSFWSADGVSFDDKSWADLKAWISFEYNMLLKWLCEEGNDGYVEEILQYVLDKDWTAGEYVKSLKYIGSGDCGGGHLVPFEVTSGGTGPDGTWREGAGGTVILALPE